MTYRQFLVQPEWVQKRQEILVRDGYRCTQCGIERPALRGLVKSFGILSLDELSEKGYELINPTKINATIEDYVLIKDGWPNKILFIGKEDGPPRLDLLKFSLRCNNAIVFGTVKKNCYLVAFYPEALDGRTYIDLNIHHKYYIIGNKPWEYKNEALTSLCIDCHKKVHELNEIFVYNQIGEKLFQTKKCTKCNGMGYIEQFVYYKNGICFDCWGEGVINFGEYTA